ncbi:glycosyltransferase family 4 protein [Agromyces sp. LHK192]|uniref:glycosyltransferase family 4 protein n=1 Tax=Agromyces sp. LHK192 TaxID=2498704 RepID=UPI001F0BD968|nr:glycosyltransferase family 4 protein [Agromyces sp. LHK192]
MPREFDVVMALNYYSPYVSGLTDAARLVAEDLAADGQRVLVVTGRHDASLPRNETIRGVEVVRTDVVARIGKGLISPSFVRTAVEAGRRARVVNLHLPMIESGLIAKRLAKHTPVVTTYQCDVALPHSLLNSVQTAVMDRSVALAMRNSAAIVPSSRDYADHSRLARLMQDHRTVPISPPTRLRTGGRPAFRETDGLHVGFLGRIVAEKGLEYLIDGFRELDDPDARLLIGGGYDVAGGSVIDRVRAHMGDDRRIRLLGFLAEDRLADFYASLDVFALPSVNSFEAFGIVQVEAMRVGVAAIASDIPGVRTPVSSTGFGDIVESRSAPAITASLRGFADRGLDPVAGAEASNARYSLATTVAEYRAVFDRVAAR